jgi:hypothetical protein
MRLLNAIKNMDLEASHVDDFWNVTLCNMVKKFTGVSNEYTASIFRVEKYAEHSRSKLVARRMKILLFKVN